MASRPVWADIDLAAVRHNARWLCGLVAPAELCAVVKAFGYGHGPVRVAEAALSGGATWLAVATVEEGIQLRQAGISEPVILLSEPVPGAMADVVAWHLTPTVYTAQGVAAAARAVAACGGREPLAVHLKVDTGMHRVGAHPDQAVVLAREVTEYSGLILDGLCTHLANADEPADPFTGEQLRRFQAVVDLVSAREGRPRVLHAANSAGAVGFPSARLDLVRCGITLYGLAPSPGLAGACAPLRAAMALKARVSFVKQVAAGERISYGRQYGFDRPTTVATVPIGYADGVPRRLSDVGGEVLIGGRRRPLAGAVTMDQVTVDCGEDNVHVGDEVVLIGRQGLSEVTAWEWAQRLGTIAYEIVCGVSARVPRDYRVSDDAGLDSGEGAIPIPTVVPDRT